MSESLYFKRIAIRRMPGFDWDEGFDVAGLGAGVNILYGPNGSGKSTTAAAIEHLLWPESAKGSGAHLFADLVLGGRSIQATLEGPLGARFTPEQPATCAADGRARYQFPLDQLLTDTGTKFAEDLTSQMSGGYSIQNALRGIEKASPSSGVAGLRKELDDRRDAYKRAEDRQSAISLAERELPELRRRLGEAEAAKEQAEGLTLALAYRDAAESWLESLRGLRALDRHAANVRESDLETATAKCKAVEYARQALRAAYGELCRHTPTGRWARLPCTVPTGLHGVLSSLCSELEAAEATIRHKQEALEGAKRALEQTTRELARYPGALEGADGAALLNADVEDLQRLSLDEEAARARFAQYAKLREVLGVDGEASPADAGKAVQELSLACAKLAEWLREGTGVPAAELDRRRKQSLALVGLAASGAVVGLAQPLVGVAIALIALICFFVFSGGAVPSSDARQRTQSAFTAGGVPGPTEWTPAEVQSRMEAILNEIAQAKERQARVARWESVRTDAEQAERDWRTMDERRIDKAGEYGVTFASGAQSLAHLVGSLSRAFIAKAQLEASRGQLDAAERDRTHKLEAIATILDGYGYGLPESLTEAERLCACLAGWEKAEEAWCAAWSALRSARRERKRFYSSLGLSVRDDETLRIWVGQAKRYADAIADVRAKRLAVRQARLRTSAELRRTSTARLQERLDVAQQEAAEAQNLYVAIHDRQKEADAARKGNDLSLALDAVHSVEAALIDHRQAKKAQRLRELVGRCVERELRSSTVPEVFLEARRLFMRVTNNEYSLTFDPETNAFGAEHLGRQIGLDGLSKGTRVQALLAVRLAWVIRQEAGPRLPILLDETLANCDEVRANAIMDAVAELCGDRQVFYFTAQADEVLRWKERLGEEKVVVIDMMSAREQSALALPPRRRVRYGETIQFAVAGPASPGELDHEAYGRALDVVAIDPAKPVDALHVWHLVSEPGRVYELVADRLVTWGQLKQACELRNPPPLDPAEARLARARAAGIESACRCWMSDKALHRIDPDALGRWLGSRVVREDVLRRAVESKWDGDALVASLRANPVARFGKGSIDDLWTWCVERGYAAAGEPVSFEDALAQVCEAMEQFAPGEIVEREARAILARVGYVAIPA